MGNRAVITFQRPSTNAFGVYIHWNGGRDSVEAFLAVMREYGLTGKDPLALCGDFGKLAKNFFEGKSAVDVDRLKRLDCDNGDNGLYIVDPATLEITGRQHFDGRKEQRNHEHAKLVGMIRERGEQAGFVSAGA